MVMDSSQCLCISCCYLNKVKIRMTVTDEN
jgi:hypothetical protein